MRILSMELVENDLEDGLLLQHTNLKALKLMLIESILYSRDGIINYVINNGKNIDRLDNSNLTLFKYNDSIIGIDMSKVKLLGKCTKSEDLYESYVSNCDKPLYREKKYNIHTLKYKLQFDNPECYIVKK